MLPWGHAAVGYLLYALLARSNGDVPAAGPVFALALGTQFPDLVDKPLGWTLGVLPGGRTLAHSLLAFVVVATVVLYASRRYRRRDLGVAFSLGYLSHPFADGLYAAVAGEYADLSYLLWPLLPMPEYETGKSFLAHFAQLEPGPYFVFEVVLVVAAVAVWNRDGRPGLGPVLAALGIGNTGESSDPLESHE